MAQGSRTGQYSAEVVFRTVASGPDKNFGFLVDLGITIAIDSADRFGTFVTL